MMTPDPSKWVDEHGDYLYNYAWTRVQSKEVAEDLVQETFVAALKGLNSFRGDSEIITWLVSILKRKVIDYYRKKSTQNEFPESKLQGPFHKTNGWEGHWVAERVPKDWRIESHEPLREEEFQKIMDFCLSRLPEKWKSVFVLKVMEEIESSEICKEIGCTSSNLWVILYRARLQLRECIENNWLK